MNEGFAYWFLTQKVKGQVHNALIIENGLLLHNCFPYANIITKLHTKTPHESRMCPMGFGGQKVKGKGHNALMTENGLCCIIAFPFTPIIMKLHTQTLHESRMCLIGF